VNKVPRFSPSGLCQFAISRLWGAPRPTIAYYAGRQSRPGYAKYCSKRVVIAEEFEQASHLKVYDLEGGFTGSIIGEGKFPNQAEGIELYACEDNGGYWIATDQGEQASTFHVFDRNTFEYLGSFAGKSTKNTDGIALTQHAFGPFSNGAFYAAHDGAQVAAFSWDKITEALNLRSDCTITDT